MSTEAFSLPRESAGTAPNAASEDTLQQSVMLLCERHGVSRGEIDVRFLVEGKIKPADVGFVHIGQAVMVKISAYDYGIYGAPKGKVELVSPGTLENENEKKPGDDTTYYRVLVRTDEDSLASGRELVIRPGMTSAIDIRTSDKTILDYLLKPVFKAKEAFRER